MRKYKNLYLNNQYLLTIETFYCPFCNQLMETIKPDPFVEYVCHCLGKYRFFFIYFSFSGIFMQQKLRFFFENRFQGEFDYKTELFDTNYVEGIKYIPDLSDMKHIVKTIETINFYS